MKKLIISAQKYLVQTGSQKHYLPRKEFQIISLLCSTPVRAFSRAEIFENVWENRACFNERIVDVYIANLRKKLGNNVIRTIYGVGYICTCK